MPFSSFHTENMDAISPILNFHILSTDIHENLKIGDIASIFSVLKHKNGMKITN